LNAGWTVNGARKSAMLVCALCVVPVLAAAKIQSLWGAVTVVSLAAAAHQGWSANLFTLASDLFPKGAVASVVGIGTFAGAMGGTLIAAATGWLLQKTHSYVNIFVIAAFAYLFALLVIQLLSPRLDPVSQA
jgi:ACS family hexuronate transporter-like MFS transporter